MSLDVSGCTASESVFGAEPLNRTAVNWQFFPFPKENGSSSGRILWKSSSPGLTGPPLQISSPESSS